MPQLRIAYICFDIVPAPKGAAVHIAAFAQTLAAAFSEIHLVTVSPTTERIDSREIYPGVIQTMLPVAGDTLIHRVMSFRHLLLEWLRERRFDVVQIRSVYEGWKIAVKKKQYCDHLIFEVNGLPSIELKYRYPAVADDRELLHKLRTQEQICLEAADLIVTPSGVTKEHLQTRGVASEKICVIPNGVDLNIFTYREPSASASGVERINFSSPASSASPASQPLEMLYFGTLSAWQGVNLAVEALELVNRDIRANLTAIAQARNHQIQALKQLASKLKVADKLTILEPMSQKQLVENIHAADVILAPLTPNDRNLVQGCCPLKILEGMATGIPVITSDLPVVREIGIDQEHFLLVKSGSAKAIKDAVLRLHQDKDLTTQLVANARKRIEDRYTWKHAGEALIAAYLLHFLLGFLGVLAVFNPYS
ncbi:MAG: glycosyltransferase family 4 protein [Rhizonema sp. PD37]|nr:glycosyltransferase family 4 protein [Rhizonema sp. PD37]